MLVAFFVLSLPFSLLFCVFLLLFLSVLLHFLGFSPHPFTVSFYGRVSFPIVAPLFPCSDTPDQTPFRRCSFPPAQRLQRDALRVSTRIPCFFFLLVLLLFRCFCLLRSANINWICSTSSEASLNCEASLNLSPSVLTFHSLSLVTVSVTGWCSPRFQFPVRYLVDVLLLKCIVPFP